MLPKLLDIAPINRLREPQRRIHHIGIQPKEVLRNLRSTRVLAVERRHEGSGLAPVVDLVVDATLGEDGAFELVEGACYLGVFARGDEPIFEDVSEVDFAVDDGEEFGGAGVHVRGVDTAGVEEAEGGADAETGEDGEGFDVLVGVRILEDEMLGESGLTAALVAPPRAPFAGLAPLKSKTMRLRRASPESRDCPFAVRRRWNRLIAVGAVKRSKNKAF